MIDLPVRMSTKEIRAQLVWALDAYDRAHESGDTERFDSLSEAIRSLTDQLNERREQEENEALQ